MAGRIQPTGLEFVKRDLANKHSHFIKLSPKSQSQLSFLFFCSINGKVSLKPPVSQEHSSAITGIFHFVKSAALLLQGRKLKII